MPTPEIIGLWPEGGTRKPRILGLGGTTRAGSSTERMVDLTLKSAAIEGADVLLFGGHELDFPFYSGPGERDPRVVRFLSAVRTCDGLIVASPAYHGSISGLLKNALDYTEDLRSDQRVYLDGLPIGFICCAGGWQAAGHTLATLRSIAHALRAWPSPIGVMVNTSLPVFDRDGSLIDQSIKLQIAVMAQQVTSFARLRLSP